MQKPTPLPPRVMWLALATLGILLLLPTSRYLLRTHLQMEALDYRPERDLDVERAIAAHRPDDYPIQLALATDVPPLSAWESERNAKSTAASLGRDRRIQALTLQFPNNPSTYANLLRYMSIADVKLWYGEETGGKGTAAPTVAAPSPEALAMFESAARKGAELEPENAYFPMMQAMGYRAAHQEREALNALETASRCTQWREYFQDDIKGRLRLQHAAYGERLAEQDMGTLYDLTFPHYAQLRALARSIRHLTSEDERAGKFAEGIALRHALMRCGGLMRAQGTSGITSLVGVAITHIAIQNPGGVEDPPYPDSGKNKVEDQVRNRWVAASHDRYCAYLESVGQVQEAQWARTELTTATQAKALLIEGFHNKAEDGSRAVQFCISWLVNLVLFCSAIVLLALGGMAHYARQIHSKQKPYHKLLPLLRAGYALTAIGGIGLWQWAAVDGGLAPCNSIYSLVAGDAPGNLAAFQCFIFGVSLLIPVLFVGLLAAISQRHGVPLAIGLGRGLRGAAIPVASVLFVLYGVSLLPTACLESLYKTHIVRTIQNEPQYWAENAHKSWPGDPQP